MLIGTLCGSLQPHSTNDAALVVAERALGQLGASTVRLGGLETLPPFRADTPEVPDVVAEWHGRLVAVDALVLASPEYAAGPPGVLKNALDWCVGLSTIYRKPVAVISAGSTGGPFTIESLVRTLSYQGAWTVATLGIAGVRTKVDGDGAIADWSTITAIEQLVGAVVAAVGATEPELLAFVSLTVTPFGIDPQRFGLR